MIQVRYKGRLGNNLFQYALGRILAEALGQELQADPIPGFPATEERIDGAVWGGPPIVFTGQELPLQSILTEKPQSDIILHGHFQNYAYYKPFKEQIRRWFPVAKPRHCPGEQDLVLFIRRTDYAVCDSLLPRSYYNAALASGDYDTFWVCTDDANDPFIRRFCKDTGAQVRDGGALDDFRFAAYANHICLAQSTFAWWAAFLSSAQTVFFPLPERGYWSSSYPGVHLQVDDEDRYHVLPAPPYRCQSWNERLYLGRTNLRGKTRKIVRRTVLSLLGQHRWIMAKQLAGKIEGRLSRMVQRLLRLRMTALLRKRLAAARGVIQVGANTGQELPLFARCRVRRLLMFEPVPSAFSTLKRKASAYPNMITTCINKALGSRCEKKGMYLFSNDFASSSFLRPAAHLAWFPELHMVGKKQMDIVTLDNCDPGGEYDVLYLDVQGYELEVLKGALKTLRHIETVYLEYAQVELYEGAPTLKTLDRFLACHHFQRIAKSKEHATYGNALYVKHAL